MTTNHELLDRFFSEIVELVSSPVDAICRETHEMRIGELVVRLCVSETADCRILGVFVLLKLIPEQQVFSAFRKALETNLELSRRQLGCFCVVPGDPEESAPLGRLVLAAHMRCDGWPNDDIQLARKIVELLVDYAREWYGEHCTA